MPARFGPGAVREDGPIGMTPQRGEEGIFWKSSAMDGVLKVGVNAPRFRPAFTGRPLPALAVALKTGRHTRRTTWVAPKGSDEEQRVSLLGTSKEMQKLRRGTDRKVGCRWGGFPAFTSHQEHVVRRCSLNTVQIPDLGGVSKKGRCDKTLSPSLLRKSCSGPWDRHAHLSLQFSQRSVFRN